MAAGKKRLDQRVVEAGLAQSRSRAQALIMAGRVRVDGEPADKPGAAVPESAALSLAGEEMPYVGRGGLKLAAALREWNVPVRGAWCLDAGASTGGFTDCLLQHGAAHVCAVDVGYGQLAWSLRNDPRVTVLERTNIRYLKPDALPRPADLVVIDTSFISLRIVVPAVLPLKTPAAPILALIKPQFEVGKGQVGKGGVVRDPARREAVVQELTAFFEGLGLRSEGVIPSPILGPKGNREFIVHLTGPAGPADGSRSAGNGAPAGFNG
jgi:23S rRNA (cytidine1920-2'-O)/16S rRNA (cytidine1409-2'-O)-methyltransferase